VTKGNDRYPEDEFDAEPAHDVPIGVHRAPRTWWSRWWPFVAVLVVVPTLTVAFVLWASSWEGRLPFGDSDEPQASAPASGAPGEAAPEDPATAGTEEPPVGEPPVEEPAPEEPPVVEEPAPPVADLTTSVRVLNAANVSGLAAGAQSDLEDAGFTNVTAGNGNAGGSTATTVFYGSPDHAATAQEVATTLGVTAVVESADVAPDGVVVLLLRDFTS
jgi:hypothetical protein